MQTRQGLAQVALLRIYARRRPRTGRPPSIPAAHSFLSVRNVSDRHQWRPRITRPYQDDLQPRTATAGREHTGIWYNLELLPGAIWPIPTTRTSMLSRPRWIRASWTWSARAATKSDHWSYYFNCRLYREHVGRFNAPSTLSAGQPTPRRTCGTTFFIKYDVWPLCNPRSPTSYIVYCSAI